MVLIDKAALLNKIAKEVHYDSEHSLEMYAKMLSLINDAPDGVVRCKDCKYGKRLIDANGFHYMVCSYHFGHGIMVGNYDFCKWGERRTDDAELH